VGLEDAQSVSDVQRLYMILAPTARPAGEGGGPAADVKPKARLIIIAKKVLPDAARHDRFMGFVSVRRPAARMPDRGCSHRTRSWRPPAHHASTPAIWLPG
jgi:hypothetical protein